MVAVTITSYGQQPAIPAGAIVVNVDSNGALRLDQERIDASNLADRVLPAGVRESS